METHIYTTPTSIVCIDEETGKAIWQLTTKQIAALREAGEKMAERLRHLNQLESVLQSSKVLNTAALAEWEAANQ